MIKVVTDSTSDIPREVARDLDIEIVPAIIQWNGETFRDGIDIDPDEFYRRLTTSAHHPTTSQPSPGDFVKMYHSLADGSEGIVSIHISSKLSGTYQSALLAREMMEQKLPIEVIDSQYNSMGLGLITIAAARVARAGGKLQDVIEETKGAISQIRMLGIFATLKYAMAGGRINKSFGRVASVLNIKPMLTFKNGEVAMAGLATAYSKGVDKIVNFVKNNLPIRDLAVVHSAIIDDAMNLRDRLGEVFPKNDIIVAPLGSSLGVHGGPGVLLVALRRSD
jgi:fatty acid kinase fatty acid binding subunit